MNWQKKARFGLAVFVVVFVAIVVAALRQRQAAPLPGPSPVRKDPSAVIENTGTGVIDLFNGDKIKFGTQFTYADGRNKFGAFDLTSTRNGKPFRVTSREAEAVMSGAEIRTAHFVGAVKLTSEALEVTCEDATYDQTTGTLTIPGAVAFTRGRMKGSGVGATYDRNRDVLWLLDQARISVAADPKGEGALEASSASAGMARADHYVKLTRNAHINAEGRVIDADEITILLTPGPGNNNDDQRVRELQLRGNSRIQGGGGSGAPQSMSARDIDLKYAEDGRTLQHAQLMENASVQLPGEGTGAAAGRRVAGRTIDIGMSPDGATVTTLNATENVQLDLPAEGDLPAKRIRSATLTAAGAGGAGLQNATFGGNVEYRETRPAGANAPAAERTARSLTLIVETKPGFGALQQADFRGNVHFTDGPQVTADATRAVYHVDRDQIDMSPTEDPGPSAPRVTDGRVTVEARTIEFALATRKLKADTKVRSSILPQPKPDPAAAPARRSGGGTTAAPASKPGVGGAPTTAAPAADPPGHAPSLLNQDQPVTVTSNRLEYDGEAGHAVYSGNARLWQADTSIRGDTIIVDDKTSNLEAHVNVQTEMTLDEVDPKTNVRKSTRTKGDSQNFAYDDARRLATYTGKAHLVGPEGDVTAEKLELFMKADANELERAEGYGANGSVIVKESGRTATGARLTYTAKTETYVMTGTPVEVVESDPPECRKSQGTALTFQRAVDAVSMTGNGTIPAVTNKVACPAESR